jgi:hypothetical protein
MAFQPAPACAQAVLRIGNTVGGDFAYANVLNFTTIGGTSYTEGRLNDLGSLLMAWDTGHMDGVRQSGYSLMDIELRGLESAEAAYFTQAVNNPGVVAGDSLPPNVAACVTLTTGFTGRSARGRMYIGGLSEVQQDGGTLTAGVVTGINDGCQALLDALVADDNFQLVVLSRFTGGAARVTANPLVVTEMKLRDAVLDTQRRRINRLKA